MEINVDTIELYMQETLRRIEFLKADIENYKRHIDHSEREIKTLNFIMDQYEKSLKIIEENAHN